MLVGTVVVQDNVHVQVGRDRCFNPVKKKQELLMPISRWALADDRTFQDIQGGKQCGRSVPLVIVSLPLRRFRAKRQNGLRPIQRLNLTLFVYAQHHRLIRRIRVQPSNISEFGNEVRISAEFE
jgi:hypothetical protein